ncbi:MAG: SRPBCC family protein [Candidatus Thorarchaeota archaeon]
MRVRDSIEIDAPPEKVWPYLVEPSKTMQWFTPLKKFEYTSEHQGGPESTFYWEELASGRHYELDFKTTEWEENKNFSFEMTKGWFKSYKETWALERTPTGCRFSFDDRIEFPYGPIGKIIGHFAKDNSTEAGKVVLTKLKQIVEAS